jgi:hypothetical protein
VKRWRKSPGLIYADAEHHAYGSRVHHRRRVFFIEEQAWLVLDDITGRGVHHVDVRFVLDPHVQVIPEPNGWTRAWGRHGLLVRSASTAPVQRRIIRGEVDPFVGWVAPTYGVLAETCILSCSRRAALPIRIATLLWPSWDPAAPAPRIDLGVGTVSDTVHLQVVGQGLELVADAQGVRLGGP